jgi:hypothetical protein
MGDWGRKGKKGRRGTTHLVIPLIILRLAQRLGVDDGRLDVEESGRHGIFFLSSLTILLFFLSPYSFLGYSEPDITSYRVVSYRTGSSFLLFTIHNPQPEIGREKQDTATTENPSNPTLRSTHTASPHLVCFSAGPPLRWIRRAPCQVGREAGGSRDCIGPFLSSSWW